MVDKLLSPIEAGINPASKYEFFNTPFGREGKEPGPKEGSS
jgi:hypothetical protein